MTQLNCSQRKSVTSECSVSYRCSFWILQKMARSSTDVCLRSSQGETDPGRIVRNPESILVFGAESTAVQLRQRRQEWRNHLLKYRTHSPWHWTLYKLKLACVADEHLFQMRPRTVNTTPWRTRMLCGPSVCPKCIVSEGECIPTHWEWKFANWGTPKNKQSRSFATIIKTFQMWTTQIITRCPAWLHLYCNLRANPINIVNCQTLISKGTEAL